MLSPAALELQELKESLQDTQPVGVLVDCCRTLDQVRVHSGLPVLILTTQGRTCQLYSVGAVLSQSVSRGGNGLYLKRNCLP